MSEGEGLPHLSEEPAETPAGFDEPVSFDTSDAISEMLSVPFEIDEIGALSSVRSERMRPAYVVDVGVALPETHARMRLALVDSPDVGFDIPISLDQASSLSAVIKGIKPPRPLSASLFCEIMQSYDLVVEFVAIVGRQRSTYLSEITLNSSTGKLRSFQCRPSDGILLALTQNPNASILVDELLLTVSH